MSCFVSGGDISENSSNNSIKHNVKTQYNYHYATILTNPVSSVIDRRGALVKLSNRELYQPDFSYTFVNFLALYRLKYKSISRLDLCYDCNDFAGKMSPRRLINSFLSGKFLKNGQPSYTLQGDTSTDKREQLVTAIVGALRDQSPEDEIDVKRIIQTVVNERIKRTDDNRCTVRGSARNVRDINYIAFGSRSSSVCSYMYDKTKELREVKDKPYIRQLWKLNGLDDSRDVWRVEISIKSDAKTLLKTDTGEIFTINTDMLKLQTDIESLFYVYAAKYFDFRINNLTKNKSRMKSVPIFEHMPTITTRPIRLTLRQDVTKSDKIFLRKLVNIENEVPYPTEAFTNALRIVQYEYTFAKNLAAYLAYKAYPEKKRRP